MVNSTLPLESRWIAATTSTWPMPAISVSRSSLAAVLTLGSGVLRARVTGDSTIAIDNSGNVYVGDIHLHNVQKFTSNGAFLMKWGSSGTDNGQFSQPFVAVDTSGNVYVSEGGNNRVQLFTSNGGFLTKWGSPGSGDGQFNTPFGIAVDGSGNVYVGEWENNRIQMFALSTAAASYAPAIQVSILERLGAFPAPHILWRVTAKAACCASRGVV
ncbi:MAG: hypothetical protein EXR50_02140 [Dehalococcoidia bacterium]|nr:hypothetical protein [Dehalococcoidia bacterium]